MQILLFLFASIPLYAQTLENKVIITINDPAVTASISPAVPVAGEELTLTLAGLGDGKTAAVTAGTTAGATDVSVNSEGAPVYTLTPTQLPVYIKVTVTDKEEAKYSVTVKTLGVAAVALDITQNNVTDGKAQKGAEITISAVKASSASDNTTITVTNITASSPDGSFVAITKDATSSLTFTMPASDVEVTIAAKSEVTVTPGNDSAPDENTENEVTHPVITIPTGSAPDNATNIKQSVEPASAEQVKEVEEKIEEIKSTLPESSLGDTIIVLDIKLTATVGTTPNQEVQPKDSITITIPYPAGTSKDSHNFRILHLKGDGTTELIIPRALTAGLQFKVNSLSDFAIGYSETKGTAAATGVTLNKTTLALTKGNSEKLTATVAPDGAEQSVIWKSSDKSIATVGTDGTVEAIAAGTATITVTTLNGGFTATCTVTVSNPAPPTPPIPPVTIYVTGVELDKATATLKTGESLQLTATVSPSDADNTNVSWTSSDETVATVDKHGKVSALKAGTATITVKTRDGGYTATCALTVTDTATAIETIDSATRVYTSGGTIEVRAERPATLHIYTVTGQLLKTAKGEARYSIPAAPGIYFVRIGTQNYKLIVR